jgi:aspartyl-tRNA(Asn)/glutamyl-tRNA(Gln) amidotransferase subunit A
MDTLKDRDVLIAPGAAIPAPKIGEGRRFDDTAGGVDIVSAILRFTQPFDVTGQPAIAIPTGMSSEGLPLAMQIIGRPFAEVTVLQVASAYEKARGILPAPPPL